MWGKYSIYIQQEVGIIIIRQINKERCTIPHLWLSAWEACNITSIPYLQQVCGAVLIAYIEKRVIEAWDRHRL